MKNSTDCPIRSVKAEEIEAIVIKHLKDVLQAPEVIVEVSRQTGLKPGTVMVRMHLRNVVRKIDDVGVGIIGHDQ
jgi:hypothetical protein